MYFYLWCCAGLSCSVMSDSVWPHVLKPQASLFMGFSSKNARVGCHAFIQEIFPTQGSNPVLPHCRQILYHLSHQGSPRMLEWVAYPFSRELPKPGVEPWSPSLQITVKRREVKNKREKERYTHLNAEFQRIARRAKKAFLSDQCKEIEENNRLGKTSDLFNKMRDT